MTSVRWYWTCRLALCVLFALVCIELWSSSQPVRNATTPKYDQSHLQLLKAYQASRTKKKLGPVISLPDAADDTIKPKSFFNVVQSSNPSHSLAQPLNFKIKDNGHAVTQLEDIFIAMKSTYKYHKTRLPLLLDTWVPLARQSVSIGHLSVDSSFWSYPQFFVILFSL